MLGELTRLVTEASAALTVLDADTLDRLALRAQRLAGLKLGAADWNDRDEIPILKERFRTFSAVLKATSENLTTLQRADDTKVFGQEIFGQERFGLRPGAGMEGYPAAQRGLFESLGLYDDSDGGSSIWPRSRMSSWLESSHAARRA